MFKLGEDIHTDTGERVCILEVLSNLKESVAYKVRLNNELFFMRWFDKELYEGHFDVIHRICKQGWTGEFVLPIQVYRIVGKDEHGFGYITPLVSEQYHNANDFLRSSNDKKAVSFKTYQAMLQACLNISASMQKVMLKGLKFRDGIHPGHFKIHPVTGEVFIIGAEELLSGDECGVTNRLVQYSAPECIETNKLDLKTENFSLAILLYRLIFIDHPFEGALWEKAPVLTRDIERQLYGKKAIYHFDPDNECNRPTDIYAPNVSGRWKVMPIELRKSFICEFTEGIKKPEKRLTAGMWIITLAKCRDKLIRLNSGRELFVNFDDARSVPPRCLGIKIGGHRVALYPQKAIYQISVDGNHYQYGKIIAKITYNKQLDSLMICNMTNTTWCGWSPNTEQLSDIPSGKEYPLFPGVLIEFQKEHPRIIGEIFDARTRSSD